MVNTGRPSRGCGRCKQRRVKCDEGHPGCNRCEKIGRSCPGYSVDIDLGLRFSHESMNRSHTLDTVVDTKEAIRFAVSPDSNSTDDTIAVAIVVAEDDIQTSPKDVIDSFHAVSAYNVHESGALLSTIEHWNSPPNFSEQGYQEETHKSQIGWPLAYDMQDQALCLFFAAFASQSHLSHIPAYLGFLPQMFAESATDSCLNQVLLTTASANLANWSNLPNDRRRIRSQYGRAIKAVNAALTDPAECLSDETAISIWLLRTMEIMTGYPGDSMVSHVPDSSWQTHTTGMLHLLRLRGPEQLSISRGRDLFRLICAGGTQFRSLFFGQELHHDLLDLITQAYTADALDPVISARLIWYFDQVTKLRARARGVFFPEEKSCNRSLEVLGILSAAEELESDMQGWDENLHRWQAKNIRHHPQIERMETSCKAHTIFYYDSYDIYLQCYKYLVTKIKLHETVLDCLVAIARDSEPAPSTLVWHLGETIEARIQHHKTITRESVQTFLGSIAFGLGDVDVDGNLRNTHAGNDKENGLPSINLLSSMWLQMPLYDFKHNEYLTPAQRKAAQVALERVWRELRFLWTLDPTSGIRRSAPAAFPGKVRGSVPTATPMAPPRTSIFR